jgi:tripartite-type tricarboxylate transporter receptor subunit TctC
MTRTRSAATCRSPSPPGCWPPPPAAPLSRSPWPDKPLKVVLPFPPGGPSDIVMRLAAEKMQATLKQPVVIENKPGAGGNLGAAEVARAPKDGYTWLFGTDTLLTVNPHVYKQPGFKPEDLQPVAIASSSARPWSATRRWA